MSAMLRWIAAVEAAAEVRDHERYYEIRYEELVRRPPPFPPAPRLYPRRATAMFTP